MKKIFSSKKRILVFFLIVLLLPIGITFSKYVGNFLRYHVFNAKSFYFSSDKLTKNGAVYKLNNWGGIGEFTIQFELNNHKNNILSSDTDITYSIDLDCGTDLTCSMENATGTLFKSDTAKSFVVRVTPRRAFATGETAVISVVASSLSPYEKTLSASFEMTVGKQGLSYEIIDSEGSAYLTFLITNALDEYKVQEAFDTYAVGDIISTSTYMALSQENRSKCYSSHINLQFDPTVVRVDSTTNIIAIANKTYRSISGVNYINSLNFDVDAVSSTVIRFYKMDKTQNYTDNFSVIRYS